jgi:hypothetical protein
LSWSLNTPLLNLIGTWNVRFLLRDLCKGIKDLNQVISRFSVYFAEHISTQHYLQMTHEVVNKKLKERAESPKVERQLDLLDMMLDSMGDLNLDEVCLPCD